MNVNEHIHRPAGSDPSQCVGCGAPIGADDAPYPACEACRSVSLINWSDADKNRMAELHADIARKAGDERRLAKQELRFNYMKPFRSALLKEKAEVLPDKSTDLRTYCQFVDPDTGERCGFYEGQQLTASDTLSGVDPVTVVLHLHHYDEDCPRYGGEESRHDATFLCPLHHAYTEMYCAEGCGKFLCDSFDQFYQWVDKYMKDRWPGTYAGYFGQFVPGPDRHDDIDIWGDHVKEFRRKWTYSYKACQCHLLGNMVLVTETKEGDSS